MIIFINDDKAYLRWTDENPDGYVINTARKPKPDYTVLHKSSCGTISSTERSNWTTTDFIKVCSRDLNELKEWVAETTGGACQPCQKCNPDIQALNKGHHK